MHQVLIIEADSTPVEASVHAALASDTNFRCRRLPWEAMPVETFTRRQPTGVVAVAVPPTPIVSQVLHRWRDRCIVPPTLAVLPRDADEPLLRVASEAVDDFMLCPVRAPELRQRLTRLLDPWRDEVEAVSERLIEEMGLEQLVELSRSAAAVHG
jgi:DNA-binding response OmpR family regulator